VDRLAATTLNEILIVRLACLCLALTPVAHANAEVYLTEGTNISVDVTADGRAVIDLLGGLWVIPAAGGAAEELTGGLRPAKKPRWSPNAETLVYQASAATQDQIWLYYLSDGRSHRLGDSRYIDLYPSWHPDGSRIIFSSARHGDGFDLWEIDTETLLTWRLSSHQGNETEPAWSADGRNLIYIHEHDGRWSIMLRRFGRSAVAIVRSEDRLAAPSWRPDGSLITYMKDADDGWSVRMAILSDPILDRPLLAGEDFFLAPVAWQDRQHFFYTADGHVQQRRFDAWSSSSLRFRAAVGRSSPSSTVTIAVRELESIDLPTGRTVIRAGRLYDGLGNSYINNRDIVIDAGRIAAVEERAERDGVIVIDLGDLTVLPGYIDTYASLPADADASLGPLLLSLGVTTLVADHPDAESLNLTWSGKDTPGPRILPADSIRDFDTGASLLMNVGSAPASPAGNSYQDIQIAMGLGASTFVSGLADSSTPTLDSIRNSRQALLLPNPVMPIRRFAETPDLSAIASTVVLGSKPNGLQAGVALHAEFRALVAAGLNEEQALKAAGVNAAAALGLGLKLGRIATGAAADLVLVDGDPLNNIGDTLRIVGIVRNGRFFSVSGLIDHSESAKRAKPVE